MSRLFHLVLGVALLLSLAMGGVAHAAEQMCLPSVEATADGHMSGDGDQIPHDESGGAHHHGGCHGHHNIAPFDHQALGIAPMPCAEGGEFTATFGAAAPPGADLRPPIA